MKKIIKQIINFIGFSGIGWILDYSTYTLLLIISKNLFINNAISCTVGASFVFVFSTRFIFQNNYKIPLFLKYIIYLIYQIILIYYISQLLSYIDALLVLKAANGNLTFITAMLSKIIVTPITMVLNFITLKYVLEKI